MAQVMKSSEASQFFLPDDIIAHILSRLPARSIARLRFVCKHWCSLTYDPWFLTLQCKRARVLHKPRILNRVIIKQITFFDEAENRIIPKSCEINLQCHLLSNYVNGLTCARHYHGTKVCLLNPTTRELVELPNPGFRESTISGCNFGLGFDVGTGKYKVVRLFSQADMIPGGCEVLTVGDQNWRCLEETHLLYVDTPPLAPVFRHGALHWFVIPRDRGEEYLKPLPYILTFDIKEEKYGPAIPLPKTSFCDQCVGELTESRGNLHVGIHSVCSRHLEIWMLRDYKNHGWTKIYSIHGDSLWSFGLWKHYVLDFSKERILFCLRKNTNNCLTSIFCYDMHDKTSRELYCVDNLDLVLHLYTESLISPRKLLSNLGAIPTKLTAQTVTIDENHETYL